MLRWLRRARGAGRPESWFDEPARALADLLADEAPRSVFCIANSDDVPLNEINAAFYPARDLLFQYNTCRHAETLAGPGNNSLFFFHMTDRGDLIHGLSADGKPLADLAAFGPGSRICFLRSDVGVGAAVLPRMLHPAFELVSRPLQGLFFRSRSQRLPSAGFASVLLLHLVNLQRGLNNRPPNRIVLCGFTGHYAGGGFLGHDFRFEQAALEELPAVVRLGPQPTPTQTRLHHDLADIFHRGYDGHQRSKADLIFDIARLHFAAGDTPAFVDFVRSSAGLNPGFSQMQWLIRTLAAVSEDAAEEGSDLAGLVQDVDGLRARWTTGVSPALGGASFESEFASPHVAYRVGISGRPRVLLVNETSKLPFNRWHLGCDLVSRTLVERLDASGLECVGWTNGLAGLNQILLHDPMARFEAVVINGEGTLHDDANRAFEIATIGRYLKGMGKKVFLINTIWHGNSARMDELIVSFDLIAARESKSVQNLRRVRPDARLVPDLCWCVDLDRPGQSPEGAVAILDCVDPATTARLGRVATTAGLQQFVMDRFLDSFHRAVRAGRPPAQAPRVLHRADIGAARGWLGGRFHGVVLALGAGAPILSTSSNTPKIEAMLSDIGLSGKALRADELDALTSLDAVESLFAAHEFTTEDWRKVHKYKAQARREIDSLFADLAALAAEPA